MTATLNLTVEQAEAVLSGRQRYVPVPMVGCPTCDGNPDGLMQRRWPDGGYTCWPCENECDQGRVPDPSWVAAAKPCETCGGSGDVEGRNIASWDSCWDCNGSGVPQVDVTAPCGYCISGVVYDDWQPPYPCDCDDNGRVSVGFVRVVGPLLEVVRYGDWEITASPVPCVTVDDWGQLVHMDRRTGADEAWGVPVPDDQLPFLAPDGPDSLIGGWVAQVEVVG